MDNRQLPLALFVALVVAAVPAQAGAALPPSSIAEVVAGGTHADEIDDATLAGMTGRYLGNDMLVGLRVELVSTWQAADGRQATASGTLQIERNDNGGFQVAIDSRSDASGGVGGAGNAAASGAESLDVRGIGQVVQIAGDGNRMANLATISVRPQSSAGGQFNGATGSSARSGDVTARVSFTGGGNAMALQLLTRTLPVSSAQMLGIRQALAGLQALPR